MSNFLSLPSGIFKIEDSAHVARLWGLRKNRPAMNYDKLSRSIRQYYKKGIIRKPDVSQRLVYQFVHPVWDRSNRIIGHAISPCTWTPEPEEKRWQRTRALTNPNGTHFHCQHQSNSWQLLHEGLSVHGLRGRGKTMWLLRLCPAARSHNHRINKWINELPFFTCMICLYIVSIMWLSIIIHLQYNKHIELITYSSKCKVHDNACRPQ